MKKLVELMDQLLVKTHLHLPEVQKLAGKLCFAQTMVMGRFGKAALRPIYEMISRGGGSSTIAFRICLEWRKCVLPKIAPRIIKAPPEGEAERPVRVYSDATGDGSLASLVFWPDFYDKLPSVFKSKADKMLQKLAETTNKIYIFELFAAAATVFRLREQLTNKRVILFVDNEAACAAMTSGTAKNKCALTIVYAFWAVSAQFDIQLWTERVPSAENPADLPSRDRALDFPTEAQQELPNISELMEFCDLSWLLQKHQSKQEQTSTQNDHASCEPSIPSS